MTGRQKAASTPCAACSSSSSRPWIAASEARLQAASAEAIDRYLERLLTADSLAAVLDG